MTSAQAPDTTLDLSDVADAYRSRLERFGATPPGVIWRTEDRQFDRFMVLLDMVLESDRMRDLDINDLGCGYGALLPFARSEAGLNIRRYHGYDICPEMVDAARLKLAGEPAARLEVAAEATREADYSFVSGTFNYRHRIPDAEWEAWIRESLDRLWRLSRRGMGFNLLSNATLQGDGSLYLADPGEYLKYCLKNFSRCVVLRHDYMPDDFTLWIFRT